MPTGQRKFAREDGKYADFLDTNSGTLKPAGTASIGSSSLAAPSDHIHPGPSSGGPLALASGGTGVSAASDAALMAALGGTALLATQVATAGGTLTFSSIPQTWNQLRLVVIGASAYSGENDRWYMKVNGDGGSNYDMQAVLATDVTASAGVRNTGTYWMGPEAYGPGDMPGVGATGGTVAGILEVIIPNYAGTTFQKVGFWRSGYSDAATAATDAEVVTSIVAWRSTAAITTLFVDSVAGYHLAAGTTGYLYGS